MAVHTYEGVIENGQIKLSTPIEFAEHAKVVVTVSDKPAGPMKEIVLPPHNGVARIPSVRFANPEDAKRHIVTKTSISKNA